MDIRDFYKTANENQNINNTNANNESSSNNSNNFDEYNETINKYKNFSQDQLVDELFSQAQQLKSEGKLNANMLNQLSSTLSPMLNPEQQNLLNSLLERLK